MFHWYMYICYTDKFLVMFLCAISAMFDIIKVDLQSIVHGLLFTCNLQNKTVPMFMAMPEW